MQPPQSRQHPDIQMLQRQIMFRQLQEMQQKQQLDEYVDPRQQNYINQLSLLNKQAYGNQISPLIKSTPIGDASQVAMAGNTLLMQHGASPVIQGFSQGLVFSQAQGPSLSSVAAAPQLLAGSLYGTPITTGNYFNQYTHIQGASPYSGNMLTRGNNSQVELPIMQPSNFSNSFVSEQYNHSSEQGYMPDGAFVPQHVLQVKNSFGQVPVSGSNNEILPGNFQQIKSMQRNGEMQDSRRRQDLAGFPGRVSMIMPETGPPRETATLDPLEEKILFNTDDISWEASLGGQNHLGAGGFDFTQAHPDNSSLFPSIQSGSWSALMQSAVAEASSSDTGAQEDRSGLSFQNPELSIDYQPSTNTDGGKQQSNWVDNNMQNIGSPCSKPQLQSHNLHMHSSFTGFQQLNHQSLKQRDGVCSDSSHGSVQQSPQNANKWSHCSAYQRHVIDEGHLAQVSSPSQNNWPMRNQEHPRSDAQNRSISSYTNIGQAGYELTGNAGFPGPASWPAVVGSNKPPNQGLFPTNRRNSKTSEDVQHQSSVVLNSVLVETSTGLNSPIATTHSREKMLDLLNKDEESVEDGSTTRFGIGDSVPLREVPRSENSDASVFHLYNNISTSQGFGLFLGSHDQKMSKSYSSHPEVESFSVGLPSAPPYLNSQVQIQHLPDAPVPGQSPRVRGPDMASRYPASGSTFEDVSNIHGMNPCGQEFPILEAMPVTQRSAMKGVSWKTVAPNTWSVVPKQPSVSHSEPHSGPSNSLPSPDSATSSLQNPAASKYHHQSSTREEIDFHRISTCSGKTEGFDCREELMSKDRFQNPSAAAKAVSQNRSLASELDSAKHLSDANASTSNSVQTSMHQEVFNRAQQTDNRNPTISAGDFEAFDRSLKPSLGLHRNPSLSHQAHSLKNVVTDPRNRLSEIDYGHNLGMTTLSNRNLTMLSQLNSSRSGDDKLLSGSLGVGGDQSARASSHSFLQGTQETGLFGRSDTENRSAHSGVASNSQDQALITAQMAASWFKRYGTLKDGQILSMCDPRAAKDAMQHMSAGKPFPNLHLNSSIIQVSSADASQGSSRWPTMATTSVAGKQLRPLYGIPQNLVALRPKKRKVAALNLLPWHKEVSQGSLRLLNISKAEVKWACATNRLKDKLGDEADVIDDVIPISGAKKRLRLTTQLMQQVFQPAPAVLLSEASLNCASITYFAARSALGDACGLTSDSDIPSDSSNMPSEKLKSPERPHKQNFSKSLEDLICLAKRLESDLLRMERRTSFLDIRAESQELEKFSIINRLAKFHSKGQTAVMDISSSAGFTPVPKPFPQRYVVAVPMPRIVPEGAGCLSL